MELEPQKIINSQGNGPFAIKTLLGWVVSGTVEGNSDHKNEVGHSAVTVNGISVAKLEELLTTRLIMISVERLLMKRKCQGKIFGS